MEGKIPIILDGSMAGEVQIQREGVKTVFEARCGAREELLRLSVYGPDGEGYLGVMMPTEGGLVLKRSFTPLAMRQFPDVITQAGRAGLGRAVTEVKPEVPDIPDVPEELETVEEPPEAIEELPETVEEPPVTEETGPEIIPATVEKAETVKESAKEEGPEINEEPQEPQALPSELEEDDYYWYASPDGALVCFDGENNLIALPEGDGRIPEAYAGKEKIIMGDSYIVYRTKDGRIIPF